MGQTCSRDDRANVPVPVPMDYEEWARLGPIGLQTAHAWLCTHHKKSIARGLTIVVCSYSVPNLSGGKTAMVEDVASLTDVSLSLARSSKGAAYRFRAHQSPAFLRAADFVMANAHLLRSRDCPVRYTLPVQLADVHTLMPELGGYRLQRLLQAYTKLNKSKSGGLDDPELDRFMYLRGEKANLPDSVFFPLFWKLVVPVTPGKLRADEWVTSVDRLCCMTETQLARWAFWELSVVGTGPGEVPFIAVSSLPRVFKDFRNAARDRTHVSRKLLEQLRVRAAHAASSQRETQRMQKEHSFQLLMAKGNVVSAAFDLWDEHDRGRLVVLPQAGRHEHASTAGGIAYPDEPLGDDEDAEGDMSASFSSVRGRGETVEQSLRKKLAYGPDDLVSFDDFVVLFRTAPYAIFDLLYLQLHFQRAIFGETWWKKRALDINKFQQRHGGFNGRGQKLVWGYDPNRLTHGMNGITPDSIPHSMRTEPVRLPRGLRYALNLADGGLNLSPSLHDDYSGGMSRPGGRWAGAPGQVIDIDPTGRNGSPAIPTAPFADHDPRKHDAGSNVRGPSIEYGSGPLSLSSTAPLQAAPPTPVLQGSHTRVAFAPTAEKGEDVTHPPGLEEGYRRCASMRVVRSVTGRQDTGRRASATGVVGHHHVHHHSQYFPNMRTNGGTHAAPLAAPASHAIAVVSEDSEQ